MLFYVVPWGLMFFLEFGLLGALSMWFHVGKWEKQSGMECPPPIAFAEWFAEGEHEQEPEDPAEE